MTPKLGLPQLLAVLALCVGPSAATLGAAPGFADRTGPGLSAPLPARVRTPLPAPATASPPAPLAAARSNAIVARRVIGRSVRGRPIIAYRKGNSRSALRVVILGQMHGNEPAGPVTARYLIRHVAVSLRADVWIIPTMTPDGAALGTRQNARGVDLNRNWPMRWRPGPPGGCCYPGPRPASEPETRAMMRFLDHIHPRFLASIHQPYGEIGRYPKKNRHFQRRLSRQLHLPLADISVGGSSGAAPTLTGWFNQLHRGTAITVEYTAHPSLRYQRTTAGYGLLRAELAY